MIMGDDLPSRPLSQAQVQNMMRQHHGDMMGGASMWLFFGRGERMGARRGAQRGKALAP